MKRLEQELADEPQPPSVQEVQRLEALQRQLLWEDIPRELMPQFRPMPRNWPETDTQVGEFLLGRHLPSRAGCVREGQNREGKSVSVKLTSKDDVSTPAEVEGIYREFRFLAGFAKHRNIAEGL